MKLPLNTDLTGKTVVITGAGGVLGGMFAKALAQAGGKVALLDLNQEAAKKAAKEISEEGYIAKGYAANVLQKESLAAAHEQIKKDFGLCHGHHEQQTFLLLRTGMGKAVRLRRHPRRGIKILESDQSLFKNPWHQSLQRTCHGIRMGKRKRL